MNTANPLALQLALGDDDTKTEGKLLRLCADLQAKILTPIPDAPFQWHVLHADSTTDAALSADWTKWEAFGSRSIWAKHQGHTWFAARVTVPEAARGETLVLQFTSQWQERPGTTDPQCLAYLDGKIAKWWMPDDIQFVETIPLGATGKINKLALRATFADYNLPTAA